MENNENNGFHIDPPSDLDSKVFAKVAPVLKENKQIHSNKRWFQIWMPVASTAALTAFSFWFLNKKANDGTQPDQEMDLQSFATLEMDEESLEIATNLDVIEDLEFLESYSEEENS